MDTIISNYRDYIFLWNKWPKRSSGRRWNFNNGNYQLILFVKAFVMVLWLPRIDCCLWLVFICNKFGGYLVCLSTPIKYTLPWKFVKYRSLARINARLGLHKRQKFHSSAIVDEFVLCHKYLKEFALRGNWTRLGNLIITTFLGIVVCKLLFV